MLILLWFVVCGVQMGDEDRALIEKAKQLAEWDPNDATKAATLEMLRGAESGDGDALASLRKYFLMRISFGTAGLRGKMGPGCACMNDLTVVQASQGLAAYIREVQGDEAGGVVIGYDHRATDSLSSTRFALLAAACFIHKGLKVYLYNKIVATPLVPFAVDHLRGSAGIMVTASHNPKADNGYKVYWANGCQIIPPHDHGIAAMIDATQEPWAKYDVDAVRSSELCIDMTAELEGAYLDAITSKLCHFREDNEVRTDAGAH